MRRACALSSPMRVTIRSVVSTVRSAFSSTPSTASATCAADSESDSIVWLISRIELDCVVAAISCSWVAAKISVAAAPSWSEVSLISWTTERRLSVMLRNASGRSPTPGTRTSSRLDAISRDTSESERRSPSR